MNDEGRGESLYNNFTWADVPVIIGGYIGYDDQEDWNFILIWQQISIEGLSRWSIDIY